VLLRGYVGDGPATWRPQIEGLSDEFTVVAWDTLAPVGHPIRRTGSELPATRARRRLGVVVAADRPDQRRCAPDAQRGDGGLQMLAADVVDVHVDAVRRHGRLEQRGRRLATADPSRWESLG
jgi:hypothetical protein